MTRLGSKLPFREAAEEVWYSCHTRIGETTLRRITHRHGAAAAAFGRQEVIALERDAPEAMAHPQQLLLGADGAFVQLTSDEWREVKSVAVGEFRTEYDPQSRAAQVKTHNLSYFSRSCGVRDFERDALAELHRRRLENARTVVAVNDGAEWTQSFLDYHCPQAVRIIDFAHAAGYLAPAGKAVWGEESETFPRWVPAILPAIRCVCNWRRAKQAFCWQAVSRFRRRAPDRPDPAGSLRSLACIEALPLMPSACSRRPVRTRPDQKGATA
jgi:hypothetical protein